ncbi:kinase-like protein [Periconia macrospinosa]|uniref:protein kinase C n=1 Tax=Periconia macrospinosa TaxID=97972 RepID=A0A2V1DDK4_9PLEO|nr:kinase-like protein [Periconia macrospinosa]
MDRDHPAIQDIYRKIDREKAIINATQHIRNATDNASVNSRIESQVREARRNIEYFEQILLDMKKLSIPGSEFTSTSPSHSQASPFDPGRMDSPNDRSYGVDNDPGHERHFSSGASGLMPPKFTPAPSGSGERSSWALPSYSKLDLIKYDTLHLGPRIKHMLSQLAFKLSLEKQYKEVAEKMIALYQMEGDDKSKEEATLRRIESNQKIQLLTRALRKYNDLYVDVEKVHDAADGNIYENLRGRKPLAGHLSITIHAVADVDHVVSGQSKRGPETVVSMKVDQTYKGRTKATRNEFWTKEQHEFDVEKANEIEFTVYEKPGADHYTPVGLLWLKMSDLADEIRRKRAEVETNQAAIHRLSSQPSLGFQQSPSTSSHNGGAATLTDGYSTQFSSASHTSPLTIDAWFSLEPVGRIHLTLGFVKQVRDDSRPFDVGLNRQGAVRQKKKTVVEHYRHKFKQQNFYSIMRCALCEELLKHTVGMQCEECKYTCHQNCYHKVITKCVMRSDVNTDAEENNMNKINHRIPHLFEAFSNIGPNWCCHCGYMLPISKRQSRKCTSCKLTYHAGCVRFVPDFCGMSMERANNILAELEKISQVRPTTPLPKRHDPSAPDPQNIVTEHKDARPMPPPASQSLASFPSHQNARLEKKTDHRRDARSVEGQIPESYKQPIQASPVSPSGEKSTTEPRTNDVVPARKPVLPHSPAATKSHMGIDQFDFIAVLGRGNFGKVMLAETKTTKQLYAIKVLKKESIIKNDDIESIRSEKRVFIIANKERHPFLYNLHGCFQTKTRIYFVMEYISGGDLMLHIQRQPFDTQRARFYAAEVCLALKYFHENGVIYRDLKLDNILLAEDGHIKLADYGLCKENMWHGSTTSTFCGTPEFMAPEIILGMKYGTAVDWWTFGVLLYQMLLQQSPFRGDDEEEIYDAILTDEPLFPTHMQQDSISIVKQLLTRQPELRLGFGPTDALEIMSHPFFRNINWDDVYHKRLPVPFLPTVKDRADTGNFDSEFTSTQPALTPVHSILSNAMQEEFRGFSYSADFD